MNVTQKCIISGKYGFDLTNSNRYAIIDVQAKNGDLIKVNQANGIKYREIWAAVEHPQHEEHPIINNENKVIVLGGAEKASKRTVFVIGK